MPYVGVTNSHVGLIISYVEVTNSYVGLIFSYVGVTISYIGLKCFITGTRTLPYFRNVCFHVFARLILCMQYE